MTRFSLVCCVLLGCLLFVNGKAVNDKTCSTGIEEEAPGEVKDILRPRVVCVLIVPFRHKCFTSRASSVNGLVGFQFVYQRSISSAVFG
jgi:hypothetical protein